jgi:molybdopterin synthase catalytic subunit
MDVKVQSGVFHSGEELTIFSQGLFGSGAVVSFTGLVRDVTAGLVHMDIEHYPAMTQSAIEAMVTEAQKRWELDDCLVIHRFGQLKAGDTIMMVATAAPHRQAAFEAAEYLMDYLKSRAPFWKKEVTEAGEGWVAPKDNDEDALKRW